MQGIGPECGLSKICFILRKTESRNVSLQGTMKVNGGSEETLSNKMENATSCGRCMHLTAQLAAAERRAGRLSEDLNRILQP